MLFGYNREALYELLCPMKNKLTKTILEKTDVEALQPDFSLLKLLPKQQAESAEALIFDREKNTLAILTTNQKVQALQNLLAQLEKQNFKHQLYYTAPETFQTVLSWYDQMEMMEALEAKEKQAKAQATGQSAEEIVQELYQKRTTMDDGEFISEIIKMTFQTWASDLHFQPQEGWVLMRMRRDWVMKNLVTFTTAEFKKYLLKIKFMAGTKMNVDYMPQDGRFDFEVLSSSWKPKKIDVRVSIMPGLRGEWIVMRFLDGTDWVKTFTELGFSEEHIEVLKRNLAKPYGMILLTWPTGSGKTTTLYSMLNHLNQPGKKIITLEEPVEYELPGVEQSPINENKGYTFEEWLAAVLRHDPDVIMVWEIRSRETAEIAFNAALTGHLVLATVHTNTAVEAITRLLNLGLKPYMLAPAINMIIGQRLFRKLHTCKIWREATLPEAAEVKEIITWITDASPKTELEFTWNLPEAVWCQDCQADWYKWRMAWLELLEMSPEIRNMIIDGKNTMEIYGALRQSWFLTMKEDAIIKMLQWYTTLDEIRRVL